MGRDIAAKTFIFSLGLIIQAFLNPQPRYCLGYAGHPWNRLDKHVFVTASDFGMTRLGHCEKFYAAWPDKKLRLFKYPAEDLSLQ